VGSLIGLRVSFNTGHPQKLVDAVYDEVIDNHPADSEVDLLLAMRRPDPNDPALMEIVDYKLYRVSGADDSVTGKFRFLATPDDDSWPTSMHKDMIRWGLDARQRFETPDSAVTVLWLHKHPEGMAYASPKDEAFNDALSSIDFAYGEHDSARRTYQGGAVINRTASEPLHPGDQPIPIGDPEVDSKIMRRLRALVIEKHGLPADHPFVVSSTRQADLMERKDSLTEDELAELRAVSLQTLMSHPASPFGNLPEGLREALAGKLGQPLGFQPPAPQPQRLNINDILGLPRMPDQQGVSLSDNIQLPKEPGKDLLN
jgi:hypothetical protein